jgi:hypothetical protein
MLRYLQNIVLNIEVPYSTSFRVTQQNLMLVFEAIQKTTLNP